MSDGEPFAWLKEVVHRVGAEDRARAEARPTCTCDESLDDHAHCKHGKCCHCECVTSRKKR